MKSKLERKDDLIDSKIKDALQEIKNSSATQLTDIESRTEIDIDSSKRKLRQSQRDLDENSEDIIRTLKDYVNKREGVIKRTLEDRRLPDHFLATFVTSTTGSGSGNRSKSKSSDPEAKKKNKDVKDSKTK